MRIKKIICLAFAILMVFTCFVGCESDSNKDSAQADEKSTYEDYQDAKVGVVTGSYAATFADKLFPNADILQYNSSADLAMALSQGKIDITPCDVSLYTTMLWEGINVSRLEDPVESSNYGIVFKKGGSTEVRNQVNTFIANIKENGVYDELHEKWFGNKEPTEFLSPDSLDGTNGVLKIITDTTQKPFVYVKNGKNVGYDIDFLTLFAKEYGYKLDITSVDFPAVLPGVASGKYDIAVSGFTITKERAKSVDFSDVYHVEEVVFIVQGDYEKGDMERFGANLKENFEKTFIQEGRWKLIVEGIFTTLIISFFAVLGGTALGFTLYLAARSKYKAISGITKVLAKIYSKLIAGMPTLVVLMVLFYVVFGKIEINGIIVAIIGFILTFGAFVYGQLDLTVDAVDKGQTEAAYALGYSRNKAFFRIVLPQAMKMFVPVYSSEIIGLIKATSVVGYIAVNDLTKMGDIIRSSTYEAFFPLITVAVIYFMITWGVAVLLSIISKKTEPKRRKNKNILKGVVR